MSALEMVGYVYLCIVLATLLWLWWACWRAPIAKEGEE